MKMFLKVLITVFARVSCNIVRFDPILDVSFKEESYTGLEMTIKIMLNNVTSEYVGGGFVCEVRKRSFSRLHVTLQVRSLVWGHIYQGN